MSTAIEEVVIAGPNGTLGETVVSQLRAAGFQVTLLTRTAEKTAAQYPGLKVVEASYEGTSVEQLAGIIRAATPNAHALVSLLNRNEVGAQLLLIEAAIAAGIERIVPSSFGIGTRDPFMRSLPIWEPKVHMEDYIRQRADEGKCSFASIQVGVFFDWALEKGFFLLNTKGTQGLMGGTTVVYDGGDVPLSTTTRNDIGKATAIALRNWDAVRNRDVFVHSAVVTQNRLLQYARDSAPERDFPVQRLDTEAMEKTAWEKWNDGDRGQETMRLFMPRATFGRGLGTFDKTDNELLGIRQWGEMEIKDFVAGYLE